MFYYQSSYNVNGNPISRIDTQSKFYDQSFLNGLSKSYIDISKPIFKEFSLRPSSNNQQQQESIQSSPIQQLPSDFESKLQQTIQKQDQFQFDIVQYCNLTIPNNEDQIAVNSINYYLNCINLNQDITRSNILEQLQQYVNLIQYLIILIQQQQNAQIAEFGQQSQCIKSQLESELQLSKRSIYQDSIQTLRETKNVQDNNFLNRLENSFQIETQEQQLNSSFNTTSQNESKQQFYSSQKLESSYNSEYQRQAEQLEAELQQFIDQKSQKK